MKNQMFTIMTGTRKAGEADGLDAAVRNLAALELLNPGLKQWAIGHADAAVLTLDELLPY